MIRRATIPADKLQLCPIDDHYQVTLDWMARANRGNHQAGWLARLCLERYFEKIEEMLDGR